MIKKVGGCIYAHKSNKEELLNNVKQKDFKDFCLSLINKTNIKYEIIKIDLKQEKLSLISSPDWDVLSEPSVGDSVCIDYKTKEKKYCKAKGQIYHHKWMFVSDDYNGFDIQKSKERSAEWQEIKEINKSKIGYRKYWNELLKQNNISLD